MKQNVEDRAAMLGEYIVENKATVRRAAKQFGVSKSTVHKDVAERLRSVDMGLYKEVSSVLAVNKAQRHIRGGICLLYTSPSPRDGLLSRMPSSA